MLRRVSSFMRFVKTPSSECTPTINNKADANADGTTSDTATPNTSTPSSSAPTRPSSLSRRLSSFWNLGRSSSTSQSSPLARGNRPSSLLPYVFASGEAEIYRDGVLRVIIRDLQEEESKFELSQSTSDSPTSSTTPSCHQILRSDAALASLVIRVEFIISGSSNQGELDEWAKTLKAGLLSKVESVKVSAPLIKKAASALASSDSAPALDTDTDIIPEDQTTEELEPAAVAQVIDISSLLEAVAPLETLKSLELEGVDLCEESAATALNGTKSLTRLRVVNSPSTVVTALAANISTLTDVYISTDLTEGSVDYLVLLSPLKVTLVSIALSIPGYTIPIQDFISTFSNAPLAHIDVPFSQEESVEASTTVSQLAEVFPAYAIAHGKTTNPSTSKVSTEAPSQVDVSMDPEATTAVSRAEDENTNRDADGEGEMEVDELPAMTPAKKVLASTNLPSTPASGKVLSRVAILEMKKEAMKSAEKIGRDKGRASAAKIPGSARKGLHAKR